MTVQTSIAAGPIVGRPGQESDAGYSQKAGGVATGAVSFGRVVVRTSHGKWRAAQGGDDLTSQDGGISLIDNNLPSGAGYVAGDSIRVMVEGSVFAESVGAIAIGTAVAVSLQGDADDGKLIDAASAASGDTVLDGVRVEQTAADGAVRVRIGGPLSNTAPTA